jgi:hypothetical protein
LDAICIWCTSFAGIVTVAWLITLVDVLAPINE